ncbi:hypothetical protein ABRZ58_08450 [Vibrio vulnificus]|uniref:hypothetical protein n=1 Tax=Vibrio vulnificus TaxID=672 RepID=UPI0032ED60C2
MRYIDPNLIEQCKPANWDVNSQLWAQRVANAINKSQELDAIGTKWKSFKPNMIKVFGDKCWYSEAPRIMTDFDVDHFRPKGAVKKTKKRYAKRRVGKTSQKHNGYWWLAYEAKNYRYSCIYANRPREEGGKHDYFPLLNEAARVWSPNTLANHATEAPKLLDPCSPNDVTLLSYERNPGRVVSRYDKVSNPVAFSRVRESAKRYNLNSKTITGARLGVIKDVKAALLLLESVWGLPHQHQVTLAGSIRDMENKLVDACDRKSAFSASAVAFVRPKRNEPWLASLLPRLDLTD